MTAPNRLAAISVDLDEVGCYTAIHGLAPPSDAEAHAIYHRALPRFEAFFSEEHVPATFFAIGQDLATDENRRALARLRGSGHEIANHTFSHAYDFSRRAPKAVREEIERGARAIEQACGEAPVGFRAPGYTVNERVFRALERLSYLYDSSVFPCPSYYAAKAVAMAAIRARGRHSRSVLDTPRVLQAPADPYRIGKPYFRRGHGLLELPIGVTPLISGRLPYIGTSLILAGPKASPWLSRLMTGRQFVNLELHGIDLAGASEDGLERLTPYQPDLRRPLSRKYEALRAAVRTLKQHGYRFVTLRQAAEELELA